MFEKLVQAAERAADGVSRRAFLGRLGRGAAAVAAAAAGVAATAGPAEAGNPNGCPPGTRRSKCSGGPRTPRYLCCSVGTGCYCDRYGCGCY